MKTRTFRISYPPLILIGIFHEVLILWLTYSFCRLFGCYTIRKATDALSAISFCYTLMGLSIWAERSLRFYRQTEHYRGVWRATLNDDHALGLKQRRWLLIVYENRATIPWVIAGTIALFISILFGSMLSSQFPPSTILDFLVRDNLSPLIRPGGILAP